MKIEKDFDTFRSIVLDEDKREVLFKGPNWLYELYLQTSPWDDPIIEQDNIMIAFVASNYIYKVHFTRTSDENYIEILNSSVGSMWWGYCNIYISKRIIKNWDRALFLK